MPLAHAGAVTAATAEEAVAASPLVVVCLLDTPAVEQVLASVEPAVAGKVLVNLTSGSPAQARANERWARERGAEYLDGKSMGDPPYAGTPHLVLPFSGSRNAFAAHESTLRELGTVTCHGEDAGLMDDLISHRESVGVEAMRMREVKELMDRRIADGHGGHGFSSLFELLARHSHT